MAEDRIYSLPMNRVGDFEFDDQVADVFPDMISRSVPGYASLLSMIEQLSGTYAVPDTHVYDLGCSLGAATFLMQKQVPESCSIYAVDNSEAMISRLQQQIENRPQEGGRIIPVLKDLRECEISNASFVVINLTLQFIPPEQRSTLLQRVADGMRPGAALVLSEKIRFEDPAQQELLTTLHHDFKRSHGYSDLEIAQKRTAIENRLKPETLAAHIERLQQVGFQLVVPWFQCFTFASILAIR
jgi:tRNA (cmo5U34)-methyltransferase